MKKEKGKSQGTGKAEKGREYQAAGVRLEIGEWCELAGVRGQDELTQGFTKTGSIYRYLHP